MKKSFLPLVLFGAIGLAFSGPYDTWTKYRNVTVNTSAAGVTTSVNNFPLLVRLTNVADSTGANVLSGALANGADIRFTDSTGNTSLSYQIDTWSPTAAAIWVKVPVIAGSAATSIRLYWGKTGQVSASSGDAVFDTANGFRGVWHLGDADSALPRPNALSIGHTATPRNFAPGYTAPAGIIGKADTLTGGLSTAGVARTYLLVDSGTATTLYNFPGAAYTHTGWIYATANGSFSRWISLANTLGGGNRIFSAVNGTNGGQLIGRHGGTGTTSNATSSTTVPAVGQWHHVAMTIKRNAELTRDTSKIFLNGIQVQSANFANDATTGFPDSMRTFVFMGRDFIGATDNVWNGKIDESRLANATRSADWIRLEYQTQRADSARVTLGTTQNTTPPTGPFAAWSQSRVIKLNTSVTGANVATTQTNFPVLIRLAAAEASIISQAKAGGADIRFAKSNDSSLPYQIERWDAVNNRAEIWVKMDTVKGNDSTQSIKMYWGNAAATTASNGTAVFDTAFGYASVWHLGDAAGVQPRPNAIAGRFAATPVSFAAGYQPRQGIIGLADSLSGGSNADSTTFLKITEGDSSNYYNFPAGKFSYTAWVNPTTADNFGRLISLVSDNGTAGTNRIFLTFNGGNIVGRVYGTASHPTNSTTPPVLGDWNHLAMTVNRGPSLDTTRLYLNGLEIATSNHNPMPNAQRNYVRIGKDYINTADFTYNGKIDEAQLSHVTRSVDFLKLSYESQRTFQKFTNIGLGVVTVPGAPTGVTASAGANGSGQVTVAWNAPTANGGSAITSYKAMAVSDSAKSCTVSDGSTTCTISGLAMVTSYTFVVRAFNSAGASAASAPSNAVSIPVGINPGAYAIHVNGASRPYSFRLSQDEMLATEALTLSISDIHGRSIWSRTVNPARDNVREISWNGRTSKGRQVSAGMYLVRIAVKSEGKTTEIIRKTLDVSPSH